MKIEAGYYLFWGGVFSNFYKIDSNEGILTSENIYMQQKALFFDDMDSFKLISQTNSPMESKRLGRKVKNFDSDLWDSYKYHAMLLALTTKYKICKKFREELLITAEKNLTIVEASPDDRIWGIGFDENNAIGNEEHWGQNLLGKALMEIRKMYIGNL